MLLLRADAATVIEPAAALRVARSRAGAETCFRLSTVLSDGRLRDAHCAESTAAATRLIVLHRRVRREVARIERSTQEWRLGR
jgi:hypothetical protein